MMMTSEDSSMTSLHRTVFIHCNFWWCNKVKVFSHCLFHFFHWMFLYFAFYYLTSMRKTWRDCLGEISIQSPIYLVIATFSVHSQKYLTLSCSRIFCHTSAQRRTYAWALSRRTWWPVSEVRVSSSGRRLSTSFRSISASAATSRQWSGHKQFLCNYLFRVLLATSQTSLIKILIKYQQRPIN